MKFSKLMKLTTDRMTPDNWTRVNLIDSFGRRCALGHMCAILGIPVTSIDDNQPAYDRLKEIIGPDYVSYVWRMNDANTGFPSVVEQLDHIKTSLTRLAQSCDREITVA